MTAKFLAAVIATLPLLMAQVGAGQLLAPAPNSAVTLREYDGGDPGRLSAISDAVPAQQRRTIHAAPLVGAPAPAKTPTTQPAGTVRASVDVRVSVASSTVLPRRIVRAVAPPTPPATVVTGPIGVWAPRPNNLIVGSGPFNLIGVGRVGDYPVYYDRFGRPSALYQVVEGVSINTGNGYFQQIHTYPGLLPYAWSPQFQPRFGRRFIGRPVITNGVSINIRAQF